MPKPAAEDRRLARITKACLALPEATRSLTGGHATFRVKDKVFAYYLDNHHGDGIVSISVRTTRGENVSWVTYDSKKFYLPAYIGVRGWVGLRLDRGTIDWAEVEGFLIDSYRLAAPKRLAGLVKQHRP